MLVVRTLHTNFKGPFFYRTYVFVFRQEFLQSLIEIVEKYGKYPEDPLMRLLLPLLLKYIKV